MAGYSQISLLNFTDFRDTTKRRFLEGESLVKDLDAVKSLYMEENIVKGTGDRRIFDEIDGQTYAKLKKEGADASKTSVIKGYTKTMIARRYAAEIDITFEARNFGKDQEILKKLTSLATFVPQRMSIDLTHRVTFATATSYTDMDGETIDTAVGDALALVTSVHTLTGSSTTYSNVITGNPSFSQGGFEAAQEVANTQILNNFGEQRVLDFNVVVTGNDPATVRQVKQLLNSTADVDAAQSGIVNTHKNMFRHVQLTRLATTATGAYDSAKKKYWAYVADGDWESHLGMWEAANLKSPSAGNNDEDVHNDDWTYGCRGTYGICVVSGKGFLLSTGVGA